MFALNLMHVRFSLAYLVLGIALLMAVTAVGRARARGWRRSSWSVREDLREVEEDLEPGMVTRADDWSPVSVAGK